MFQSTTILLTHTSARVLSAIEMSSSITGIFPHNAIQK